MPDIVFRTAWMKNDPVIARDARALWLSLDALPPAAIEERLPQLCAAAYSADKLVAVSTADFFNYPPMRSRFFYYRTTVASEFRRQKLASRALRLFARSARSMVARTSGGEDEGASRLASSSRIPVSRPRTGFSPTRPAACFCRLYARRVSCAYPMVPRRYGGVRCMDTAQASARPRSSSGRLARSRP